jgi:hypothetical protein
MTARQWFALNGLALESVVLGGENPAPKLVKEV